MRDSLCKLAESKIDGAAANILYLVLWSLENRMQAKCKGEAAKRYNKILEDLKIADSVKDGKQT